MLALKHKTMQAMPGLLTFYFGADEETSSLTNVSLWASLEAAKQLDTYPPMLDLGKPFSAKGATFERGGGLGGSAVAVRGSPVRSRCTANAHAMRALPRHVPGHAAPPCSESCITLAKWVRISLQACRTARH